MIEKGVQIKEPKGKLGVLLVGLGAVSTTFIAGVEAIKRGLAAPIGSLAEIGTIRLGKRTEARVPRIREFVPLAEMDDLVFGAWDPFEDDAYTAAEKAGVLEKDLLRELKPMLEQIRPMRAVFDSRYVKKLDGTYIKQGKTHWDFAQQLTDDILQFQVENQADRLVMIWCGSTEIFLEEGPVHRTLEAFEKGLRASDPGIPSSMIYAYAALKPIWQWSAQPNAGRARSEGARPTESGPHMW